MKFLSQEWRDKYLDKDTLHEIIFEADTPKGKIFDIVLLILIVLSVVVVMLETLPRFEDSHLFLDILEWVFTILFTMEYILRLYCVKKPSKYATSFFGVIDLLAILPAYIELFITGAEYFLIIRILRLLRIFRIFKLVGFLRQGRIILLSLRASKEKIIVFLFFIILLACISGSIMYIVEGNQEDSNFDSIPRAVYWSIVTITTVGYGDISPNTAIGQFIAAAMMIIGYAVIAVPTGIVSSEFIKADARDITTQACKSCSKEGHDTDALYCKFCGDQLYDGETDVL